jgi:hypothetical protein
VRRRHPSEVVGWAVSAAIHLVVVLLAFLITWTVVRLAEAPRDPVVADFSSPAFEPLASLEDLQTLEPPSDAAPAAAEFAELLDEVLATAAAGPLDLIAGTGRDGGSARATLAADAPDAVSFAGLRATNARTIVYVVDASGSMIGAFRTVVDELARSLSGLVPAQSYAVIFFQRNAAVEVPPANRLVPVSRRAIEDTLRWIRTSVIPAGRSNPLEALRKALALRPDCIFLLSCNITGVGQFELDAASLLETLDRLNPIDRRTGRRRTQIQCIQFLDPDPLGTMRRIAELHGGGENAFRFLDRAELGLAPAETEGGAGRPEGAR